MRWAFIFQLAALVALSLAFKLPCGVHFPLDSKTMDIVEGIRNKTLDPGALGQATTLGPRVSWTLWPRNAQNEAEIPYCYYRQHERDTLKAKVDKALTHWMNALGGPASAESGHGIVWRERQIGGNYALCNPSEPINPNWWNIFISSQTLMIGVTPQSQYATVGYSTDLTLLYAMKMVLSAEEKEHTHLHEMGHVMGLSHEHQRADRDMFVQYQCEKMIGFDASWEKVKMMPFMTKERLCTHYDTASMADFAGAAYITGHHATYTIFTEGTPYDVNSIMHYESTLNGNKKCRQGEFEECPLLSYKNPSNHRQGLEIIPIPYTPSQADIKWLKSKYPWRAPPDAAQPQPQPIP